MGNPIVEKIIKEGVNSVNLSMLDESSRKKIISEAADKLYKSNNFIEAINILSDENLTEELAKMGEEFMHYRKYDFAALCFIPLKDKSKLNEVGINLIKDKNYKLAAESYKAAGNMQMADFIKTNFC